jgi:hypothetical protein
MERIPRLLRGQIGKLQARIAVQAAVDNRILPGSNADLTKDGVSILLTQCRSRSTFYCKRS